MDDLGLPRGVRAPPNDVLDTGRGGAISVREDGLADDMLARELGRLKSDSGPRFGRGPKDRRLTLDSLSRGTWLLPPIEVRKLVGVVSSPATDDVAEPIVRFRERTVTVDGTPLAALLTDCLGDARGGVCVGAGNLDRADCTRASKRCIWAVRERMCVSELEPGSLWVARGLMARLAGVLMGGLPVDGRLLGMRVLEPGAFAPLGFGVASADGRRVLRAAPERAAGVFCPAAPAFLGRGADASDMGGDGGSCTSERVSTVDIDFVSGGVVTRGELAVDCGEEGSAFASNVGDSGTEMSVDMVDR